MSSLTVGDAAPNFQAVLQDGSTFNLADLLGKKIVVLFF